MRMNISKLTDGIHEVIICLIKKRITIETETMVIGIEDTRTQGLKTIQEETIQEETIQEETIQEETIQEEMLFHIII